MHQEDAGGGVVFLGNSVGWCGSRCGCGCGWWWWWWWLLLLLLLLFFSRCLFRGGIVAKIRLDEFSRIFFLQISQRHAPALGWIFAKNIEKQGKQSIETTISNVIHDIFPFFSILICHHELRIAHILNLCVFFVMALHGWRIWVQAAPPRSFRRPRTAGHEISDSREWYVWSPWVVRKPGKIKLKQFVSCKAWRRWQVDMHFFCLFRPKKTNMNFLLYWKLKTYVSVCRVHCVCWMTIDVDLEETASFVLTLEFDPSPRQKHSKTRVIFDTVWWSETQSKES